MEKEHLDEGIQLMNKIEKYKEELKKASYTQYLNVAPRCTYLKVYDETINVPEELFRIIGKLIVCEYETKIIELQEKFKKL